MLYKLKFNCWDSDLTRDQVIALLISKYTLVSRVFMASTV